MKETDRTKGTVGVHEDDGSEADDDALVRRIQSGDAAAAECFVRRHQSRLGRLARMWSDSEEDARDAVQEALVRGISGISAFRFRSHPLTWLVGMLRNVCAEQRRANRRRPTRIDPDEEVASAADALADRAALDDLGPRLHAWLAALPDRQRDAVVLRVLEELPVKDTAAIMGCREGTVKALLHQGMANLRRSAEREGNQ